MGREKQKPRRLGMIYKRKMKCKDGTVTESSNWYIKYHRDGVPYYECTGTHKEKEARDLLQTRLGEVAAGKRPGEERKKVRFKELMEDLTTDYELNGKDLVGLKARKKHLSGFFGGMRVQGIPLST
jgi:hypothetical protein